METERTEPTELCRAAADNLGSAANRDIPVLFPGWDDENSSEEERGRCEAVRRVAAAIVGSDDPDGGTTVTCGELAELLHYITDMLEE
jgi:hypothetical protein